MRTASSAKRRRRFTAFVKDNPDLAAGRRRHNCGRASARCNSKQFAEAQKTLTPLLDKEPRLADQCLFWIAKAQAGEAGDPGDEQELRRQDEDRHRHVSRRRRAHQRSCQDRSRGRDSPRRNPAGTRRHAANGGQYKDAVAAYNQILTEKLIPSSAEEEVRSISPRPCN